MQKNQLWLEDQKNTRSSEEIRGCSYANIGNAVTGNLKSISIDTDRYKIVMIVANCLVSMIVLKNCKFEFEK